MIYKHNYFQLNTESRKVFDENDKELRLTGNPFRMLIFLCQKKNATVTDIGGVLDYAKDYDEEQIRQYRYKINTIIGYDIVEYKNGIYSLIGDVEGCNTLLLQKGSIESGHMNKNIKFNIYPAIIVAILLLLSFFPWPYGYYTFLRWVVTAAGVYYAYYLYTVEKKNFWLAGCIVAAILFNPLVPIYLGTKSIWSVIDVIVAAFFISLIIKFKKK